MAYVKTPRWAGIRSLGTGDHIFWIGELQGRSRRRTMGPPSGNCHARPSGMGPTHLSSENQWPARHLVTDGVPVLIPLALLAQV